MSLTALLIWLFSLMTAGPQTSIQCHPVVENVRFDGKGSWKISERILVMHREDQLARNPAVQLDDAQLMEADRLRREEVMGYLQAGQVITSSTLFSAALIFQHGDCPDHYKLAADLALRAYELKDVSAGWLYAAATDRYLLSIGQLQRYGTQYVPDAENHFVLCPVNPATTDEERAEWGLPPLAELQARAAEFDKLMKPSDLPTSPIVRLPVVGKLIDRLVSLWRCAQ
jgi:hypothetical protein